ncbi:hypothetical protein [Solirubrobacter deserti]|uniref:Uncharacterized protein n=1 Tax=Solirubrobacter deserti TaxID=2282478 RepID=A0ABT4RNR7_9ACTN|nr:hypothetical protein [Solirubrobacter deserti]MDA0140135.1 hypothetical protein [Solirubrobacter deserti]
MAATAYAATGHATFAAVAGTQIPVVAGLVGALAFAYAVFVVRDW